MKHQPGFVLLLPLIWLTLCCESRAEQDHFHDQVVPILQHRCLSCHNDKLHKGEFSLSTGVDLRDSGFIDSADPASSYFLELITPQDGHAEMPRDAEPLSAEERQVIQDWIEAGARWPENARIEAAVVTDRNWWSLQPIEVHSPPETSHAHPIDAFLQERLNQQQIQANPSADEFTLIRRVTYDLTGLPPTPAEVKEFLAASLKDPEQAWRNLVDRLLDSPGFGEKWAQHWLDVSRYAETHGYDKDKPRNNAWPYRDYVIRSFNHDKPYTQFVQEQLAGDVMFAEDPDGVLGLGFLAAGPWDFIGHWEVGEAKLDGRIAKHLDRDEMISAVFNVFLSTTVQCAQCHHHKFDPIRMEDYYRLHAVFAAVDRADRVYRGLSGQQQEQKRNLQASIHTLQTEQKKIQADLQQLLAEKVSGIDRRMAELQQKYGIQPMPQYGYHSNISQNDNSVKWVQLDLGKDVHASEIQLVPAYDDFANIGAGFGFPVRYRIEVSNDPDFRDAVRILHDATGEDQPNPQMVIQRINTDGHAFRNVRITATKLRERKDDFIFALAEVRVVSAEDQQNLALGAEVSALDSIESGLRWGKANLVDGIYYQELSDAEALIEFRQLQAKRAAIEQELKPAGTDARLTEIQQELNELNSQLKQFPAGELVFAAATHFQGGGRFQPTDGKPRLIHLLHRGDLRSPGERLTPGAPPLWSETPVIFLESPTWNEGTARAELARYLTAEENPLFWRSIANRLWQWTFGKPLVGSPNDFGRGGMQPTQPKILDYLAARLRDDPQHSLKNIIRLLVSSQAYRRSCATNVDAMNIDANNTLLWQANRRRLTAEEYRDSLLVSAGVLKRDAGGPSFQDFVIEKPQHSPHYEYHLHDPADEASHRRTIYRFVVRSQPQPLLTTLDCADPSISTPERTESTTALQALTAWNNRLVEYAASQLGQRMRQQQDPMAQVDFATRLVLGRSPLKEEAAIMRLHLQQHGAASLARVLFNMNAFVYLD